MKEHNTYRIAGEPAANPKSVLRGKGWRITVLTDRLIRLEYDEAERFEDRSTYTVVNRLFDPPEFNVIDTCGNLEVTTECLRLRYNGQPFSSHGLSVELAGGLTVYNSKWHYGDAKPTLPGTARTLDEADGKIDLEPSVMSYNGYALLDDSESFVFSEDGWVEPRAEGTVDLYFFGYGRDYYACLEDFHKLTGPQPLLPRFALGNWWSRFYRYTEQSYMELVERFERERIPLAVSVLDMDWHITNVDPKYGSGWTGYTWNKEYFPDPARFLGWLHRHGLRVTVNVHPADGVRAFEDAYEKMAEELGIRDGRKIDFDAGSREFMSAYFKYLHHPNEAIGVDFWWVDWQQSGGSSVKGLDTLRVLNHFHFTDSGRTGKRPLTFSRYAGPGSHRYPVGFSGDSCITWASLDFQPFFTAAASNIGYGWWSHDIGGHMHGVRDRDLEVRWLQFGVFSPIMRLHSSNGEFNLKEPWSFDVRTEKIMADFLRLRHKMIPWLYTMNYRAHVSARPLIQPLYYRNPEEGCAYGFNNEYWFGDAMLVCPVTTPVNPELDAACVRAWLPTGTYYDLFLGRRYIGGREMSLYRPIETIPVFCKAGAIIPMCAGDSIMNGTDTPRHIELFVFLGAENDFEMYEDNDLCDAELRAAYTDISLRKSDAGWLLTVKPVRGEISVTHAERKLTVKIYGASAGAFCEGFEGTYDARRGILKVECGQVKAGTGIVLEITEPSHRRNPVIEDVFDFLHNSQIPYDLKSELYNDCKRAVSIPPLLSGWVGKALPDGLFAALTEIITADPEWLI